MKKESTFRKMIEITQNDMAILLNVDCGQFSMFVARNRTLTVIGG